MQIEEHAMFIEHLLWSRAGFPVPVPATIKRSCLSRHGLKGSTWIETGTFRVDTTQYLSRFKGRVITIEPHEGLFARATSRFAKVRNVTVVHGLSEQVFPDLLPTIKGAVNFWLDGHYSRGETYRGPQETPIKDELGYIAKNISNFDEVCVFVDDIRLFGHTASRMQDAAYPDIDFLVAWAQANGLHWTLEYDIFIAKSPSKQGK